MYSLCFHYKKRMRIKHVFCVFFIRLVFKRKNSFQKLFLRTVFENTKYTIFVFLENYSCFLNLVFYMYFVFSGKKKRGKENRNQTCSS